MVDVARRLCDDNQVYVAEIWSFHTIGDQVRFTLVFRNKETPPKIAAPRAAAPRRPSAPPPPRAVAAKHAKPVKKAKAKPKPAKKKARK
jgi:hypothetical protein